MPLQKQNFTLNFGMGIDTKTDPFQLPLGRFAAMQNSVFKTTNQLSKRNGFGSLTALPDTTSTFLTTFNGNLSAIGTSITAYNQGNSAWINRGTLQPLQLSTLPVVRNSLNQTQCDSVQAPNGSICTVFTQSDIGATHYYYTVIDGTTGQTMVSATQILTPQEAPRVFLLGNYFMVVFSQSNSLKYMAVPIYNPTSPGSVTTLVTNYAIGATQLAFDGVVFNNTLFLSYNATDGGGAVRGTSINSFLVLQTSATGVVLAAAKSADMISVASDSVTSEIWTSFYKAAGTTGYSLATDTAFNSILAATQIISSGTIKNITSVATASHCNIFYETSGSYSFDNTIPNNSVTIINVITNGTVSAPNTIALGVGLASKAAIVNSGFYMLVAYQSPYQPTYFLMGGSGQIIAKLAYQNGGGYLSLGLPQMNVSQNQLTVSYLFKDLITSVNKGTSLPVGSQVNGIYSQTGINLATFHFTTAGISTSEIGANLHVTGGFLWSYDGTQATENNFLLYPDLPLNADNTYHGLSTATGAGGLVAQTYFYQVTYEWTDQQGNAYRSAPSVPVSIVTTTASSTNTLIVPTLRLTYKTNVKIVVYRWSQAQQAYYQITSISVPTLSSTTANTVTVTDTFSDATILGNSLLYTSGGVVEDIGPPSFKAITLYGSRLIGIESEDPNTLWFSKQVISQTPVEMSDLFTIYVSPTIGSQGSTGPNACLFPMDDKLILFKENAGVYYLTGVGPDNTGANNDFSNPVFITTTVGCNNQSSIVLAPNGLMFQDGTGKGIWLLGRDLSTTYIGREVEAYNNRQVTSAFAIPGTNQIRFTLDNGTTLVYDYFQGQWDVYANLSAVSSCLYQNLHTYINSFGQVYQETPNQYVDGNIPVVMSFTTSWINVASLEGFERAYSFYLLGTYLSPHKLTVSIAYDYNPSPVQMTVINPLNFSPAWGSEAYWGSSSEWGGNSNVEQWRIFFQQQQCQAFQITISESYDPSFGTVPGPGFTLSGIDLVVGLKKGYPRLSSAVSTG